MTTQTLSTPVGSATWWGQALLRGMGQVFFMDRPVAGTIMIAGLAAADLWLALFSLVGIAIATVTAWLARLDGDAIGAGLQGYCAALVGAASYVTWGVSGPAWLSVAVGAIVVVSVTVALATVLNSRPLRGFRLTVLTAPFCIVSGVIAVVARGVVGPSGPVPPATVEGPVDVLTSALTGIGQVVFADSAASGALILLALFVGSWRAGAGAALGAAVTTLAALAVGLDQSLTAQGLHQYSAVLVGIAVLAVVMPDSRPRWLPWLVAAAGALATMLLPPVLSALGIPVYTWPFILVTWVIAAGYAVTQNRRAAVSSPRGAPVTRSAG